MIDYNFNINKVVQVINYILKKSNGSINYTKLIKLLYISDKDFLSKTDYTITGDSYCSMDNGPVLSTIYDLVRGKGPAGEQSVWDRFFYKKGYDLELVTQNNLPADELCEEEIEIIDNNLKKFRDYSFHQMIEYLHDKKKFPEVEWDLTAGSSKPLRVEKILESLGRSKEEIKEIQEDIEVYRDEEEFFSKRCK